MSDDLGTIRGSIEIDLGQLRQALAQASATMAAIERSITQAGVATDRAGQQMTAAMRQTAQSMQRAEQATGPLASRLREAGQSADAVRGSFSRAAQAADATVDGLRASATAAAQTGRSFADLRRSLDDVGGRMMQTGGILSAGITAPLALAGAQAFEVTGQYEQAMNVFQATTKATEAQMAQFAERATALGADLQLPGASAADAAEVMLELARAGLTTGEAMDEARGAMALAATEAMNSADAATIAASAYNTFHDEGLRVAQIADMLAAGSSASSASVSSLSQGMQQAGTSFADANIPLRDLIAQMSLMANAGIQGSDAGTSLKTMIQRLQGPTDEARAEMERLGISIYDSQGAMRPMRELVGQFSESLAGLTQEQRDQAIITIFGSDAQRAASIVLAGGVEQYDAMTEAVAREGAAAELAAAKSKGITGAIDGLQSTIETAMLEGLKPFMDGIAGLINGVSGMIGAFNDLSPSTRNFIVGFAAAAAAIGPVVLAAGALATAMASVSIPVLAVGAAIAALAGALASGNPVVIGATAAMAAWALTTQIKAIPAVLSSVPAIMAQTAALVANTGAALAASGPFIVLAAAVAGAVAIYQKWTNIGNEAAQMWLDQNPAYQEATASLERYNEASDETKARFAEQATALQRLQEEQAADLKLRAEAERQGNRDQAWWDANTAAINTRTERIQALTGDLNTLMDAEAEAASMTQEQVQAQQRSARAVAEAAAAQRLAAGDIQGALNELRATAGLSEEAMQSYYDALGKAAAEGAKAFGAAVGTEAGFLTEREDAQQTHVDRLNTIQGDYESELTDLNTRLANATTETERKALEEQIANLRQSHIDKLAAEDEKFKAEELKAAEAYARQQAAQLAHLGQMLIDYVRVQATMAGISEEQIGQMTNQLAAQYGVQQSLTDRSFGQMTQSLDAWVASGGQNTDQYLTDMQRIQDATVTMQQQVDAKITEMTAQAQADFAAGKLTVDEYADKLTRIPAEAQLAVDALLGIPTSISSTVTITTVEKTVREGTGGAGNATTRTAAPGMPSASGTRATGGPVQANRLYEVAERGMPELLSMAGRTFLLMGAQGGTVVPAMQAAQAAMQNAGAMAQRAALAAPLGGGGDVPILRNAPISITVAPVFHGLVVDTAERVQAVSGAIAAQVRAAVAGDLRAAIDRLETAGGVR